MLAALPDLGFGDYLETAQEQMPGLEGGTRRRVLPPQVPK